MGPNRSTVLKRKEPTKKFLCLRGVFTFNSQGFLGFIPVFQTFGRLLLLSRVGACIHFPLQILPVFPPHLQVHHYVRGGPFAFAPCPSVWSGPLKYASKKAFLPFTLSDWRVLCRWLRTAGFCRTPPPGGTRTSSGSSEWKLGRKVSKQNGGRRKRATKTARNIIQSILLKRDRFLQPFLSLLFEIPSKAK